jgi:hypothetical protein
LMNNEKYIPVLYPIGSGKSQITNFKLLKWKSQPSWSQN